MSLLFKLTQKANHNVEVLKGGPGSGNWGHTSSKTITGLASPKGKLILEKAKEAKAGVPAFEGLDKGILSDAIHSTNSNKVILKHLEMAGYTNKEVKQKVEDANNKAVMKIKEGLNKFPKIAIGTGLANKGNFLNSYFRLNKNTIGILTENKDNYGRLQSIEVSHLTKGS